ncbi:hypothetical protein JCM16161A_21770 [Vulcanisaeta sp. JCM 16161]
MKWTLLSPALLLLIIILIALGPSLTPFDAYNTYWDGYSTASSICLKPTYTLPNNLTGISSIFIIPETNLSRPLVNSLLNYVVNGGRLVVIMGNRTLSNQLLSELGVGSRFMGGVIEDPVLNIINEKFPLAFIVSNPVVATNATVIALDDAAAIRINDPNAVVIAVTSEFSVLGNSTGPFPVVVAVPIGRGYVVLVSSPGIFINSMINEADNAEFLASLCGNGTALFLEGALASNPQVIVRAWLLTAYAYLSTYPINYLTIVMPIVITIMVLLIRRQGMAVKV